MSLRRFFLIVLLFLPMANISSAEQNHFTNSIGIKMQLIPAGTFKMGSAETESDQSFGDAPQREISIPGHL